MKENETMKATELIKKLIDLVGEHADCDVIIDYDCRRIEDVIFDESGDDFRYDAWFEIQTTEEENHRKFYSTLGWRKCRHEELNQQLNIRTTESGGRFLIVDGYEIDIDTLLKLPKED